MGSNGSSMRQLVTSKKELEEQLVTSKLVSKNLTSLDIRIRALTIAEGLTVTENGNDMTAWYCKAFKSLGEGKYTAIAQTAWSGHSPKKLFGYLLRVEMAKRG